MFMFNVLINKAFQLFTFRFAPDLARNGIGVRGWTEQPSLRYSFSSFGLLLYSERYSSLYFPLFIREK